MSLNMKKLKVGSKIKVIAPDRAPAQIGTGIGLVSEIESPHEIWVKLVGSDSDYFTGRGTCFSVNSLSYTFKVLKY
jgi:hypothetical protein